MAITLVVLLASQLKVVAGLQMTPPKPSEGQLALMQRGYKSSDAAQSVPPSMGATLLPGLTMFMHFGPCTFLSTGYHSSHGCQWDIQAPLGAPSGRTCTHPLPHLLAPSINLLTHLLDAHPLGQPYPHSVGPAKIFNPIGLDTDQWMRTAIALGASQVCLTVRHVDGFALWPTKVNNYSVASSSWRDGKGDVVADFVASARKFGISPCFYVILGFDVYSNQTGVSTAQYLQNQKTVLTELLTGYGHIDRLWWDNYAIGCCQPVTAAGFFCNSGNTGPVNATEAGCPAWNDVIGIVRSISPATTIVPGPDGCLVNGETPGGTYPLFDTAPPTGGSYSCRGSAGAFTRLGKGNAFVVSESDFSFVTRKWFWNPDIGYMRAGDLWSQFTLKYGQGANLILNVPPNRSGLVPQEYIDELVKFGHRRLATYSTPVAALKSPVTNVCASLSIEIEVRGAFDQTVTVEDLSVGQNVKGYSIERRSEGGVWAPLKLVEGHGVTVGSSP